jgi:hypothetical protein
MSAISAPVSSKSKIAKFAARPSGRELRGMTTAHEPAQPHLSGGLAVPDADPAQRLVGERPAPRQRAVGRDREAIASAGLDHLRLTDEGMPFDLVGHQRLGRKLHRLRQQVQGEVRDADVPREPLALHPAQRADGVGQRHARVRPWISRRSTSESLSFARLSLVARSNSRGARWSGHTFVVRNT